MFQQCCVLLMLLIISHFGQSSPYLPTKMGINYNRQSIMDEMLTILFSQCQLGIKDTVILEPTKGQMIGTHLNLSIGQQRFTKFSWINPKDLSQQVTSQCFVGFVDSEGSLLIVLHFLYFDWSCNRDCIVILISRPNSLCRKMLATFEKAYYLNLLKTYYVCNQNPWRPKIYTFTKSFDNHTSTHWRPYRKVTTQYYNWTIYYQYLYPENLCQVFETGTISSNSPISVGIFVTVKKSRDDIFIDNGKMIKEDKRLALYYDKTNALSKLLNLKFQYVYLFVTSRQQFSKNIEMFLHSSSVDVVANLVLIQGNFEFADVSYPISYENLAIVTCNQGFATPLEKIAMFFGFWTLGSLIILLLLTFSVIWFKTNGNISFAAFNVIRLLINSGVNVPLNTLSLKIFFSMIFLYFLIIHALFSGHIAEFLTIPSLRKNIESVEDLKTSRIKTIYSLGYHYTSDDNTKLLKRKTVYVSSIVDCLSEVINISNVACIGPIRPYRRAINDQKLDEKLYLGKNQFSPTMAVLPYKKRFLLREKFNWALMTLSEMKIINRFYEEMQDNLTRSQTIKQIRSQVDFRPIHLKDLTFAFRFLIIGNSLATICFFFELLIARPRNLIESQ